MLLRSGYRAKKQLMPKDFECLDDGWKNENCRPLPIKQTWDWHQGKEATGGEVLVIENREYCNKINTHQKWNRRLADKLSAAAARGSTKVGGGAQKLSAA